MSSDKITLTTNPTLSCNEAKNCILRFATKASRKIGHRVDVSFLSSDKTQEMTVVLKTILLNPPAVNVVSFAVSKAEYENQINNVLQTTEKAIHKLVDGYNQGWRK